MSYKGGGGFLGDDSHLVELTEVTRGAGEGGRLIPGLEDPDEQPFIGSSQ